MRGSGPGARAGAEPFRVDAQLERDGVRVVPVGELDLASAGEVEERLGALCAAGVRRFVLDLRGLTFLDSSGVRLIVGLDGRAREDGIEFALIEGPAKVQRVFGLCGLLDRLPFHAGIEGAEEP